MVPRATGRTFDASSFPATMEVSGEIQLQSGEGSAIRSNASPRPDLAPHYIISAHEITVDQTSHLGGMIMGRVFKGRWNNSVVAVKFLSQETLMDVGQISVVSWRKHRTT